MHLFRAAEEGEELAVDVHLIPLAVRVKVFGAEIIHLRPIAVHRHGHIAKMPSVVRNHVEHLRALLAQINDREAVPFVRQFVASLLELRAERANLRLVVPRVPRCLQVFFRLPVAQGNVVQPQLRHIGHIKIHLRDRFAVDLDVQPMRHAAVMSGVVAVILEIPPDALLTVFRADFALQWCGLIPRNGRVLPFVAVLPAD